MQNSIGIDNIVLTRDAMPATLRRYLGHSVGINLNDAERTSSGSAR